LSIVPTFGGGVPRAELQHPVPALCARVAEVAENLNSW
jgi:hypothetical protein